MMTNFRKFKIFVTFAALLALAISGSILIRKQNESAVGANVLIELDRADVAYDSLAFLPYMEEALKKAEATHILTPLHPSQLKKALTPVKDDKEHELVWELVRTCNPGERKELLPPDPVMIDCAAMLDSTRAKLNRTLGSHLADASLGVAYLVGTEAVEYQKKEAPLCRKIFTYARENAMEDYFEVPVLQFYFTHCDEAQSRILLSKEMDASLQSCTAQNPDVEDQIDCMEDVIEATNFDNIAKPTD